MELLKKTFRWFGPSFGVPLQNIKELGINGIVTACHQVPTGEVWPTETIAALKAEIESHDMEWVVVESVNIHKAIKYGLPERDAYIQNYIETLKNLAENKIYTVCYNFMQLIDWTRTDLNYQLPTGAISLLYDPLAIAAFDLFILKRNNAKAVYDAGIIKRAEVYFNGMDAQGRLDLEKTILAGMPGSKEPISMEVFKSTLEEVSQIGREQLKENLAYFLRAVIPEAEKLGVKMAIHPDDPPFSVFGIPRIASTYEDLQFIINSYPSPCNGLTFCSGSLGAIASNDLPKIIQDFGKQIHFIHLRNITRENEGRFYEAAHLDGSIPMGRVMLQILKEQLRRHENGLEGVAIPIRPDHGHLLLDDKKRKDQFYPGYSLLGRAKGMAELHGLEIGLREVLLKQL
ncbi:mannonate dehydratase [Arenibacter nanhaiticus]|uniref:Mannonate dehydratase n=1 Tax=Arenibacter nanhaiticus TaxID=558155 RepID=A0A1M6IJI4_9FLAO|nr:mannonate dehydratase [Arenibacter nanhaiticus]SHJ34630.1 mannonate dehydratase [Arenibacter nanhaiticus]